MSKEVSKEQLENMRHTAAHILAAASRELKPETKLGVGPATETGFFHDIDVDENFTEADLSKLRKKMIEIKNKNLSIEQREVSKEEARELFKDDPYKLDLVEAIENDKIGISDMGDGWFVTLCEGGHVESTSKVGEFKLTHLSGVYWQGDDSKPQLQRIFGVLFPNKEELKQHLAMLEEAKKRDHRKLGQELDLFTFSPLVGAGLPMFTPRGAVIRQELEDFVQELQEPRGYERVFIPHITKKELYETSGHWEKFKDDLFHAKGMGNAEFVMKPMNCPHHTQIYASKKRSYRDLPLRYSEVTTCYRDEQAGELQGLSRVRALTQDDAHVFCTPDQIKEEINSVYEIVDGFYQAFDFEIQARLSLWDPKKPEKYLGKPEVWEKSQTILRDIMKEKGVAFIEEEGEAAFYGPKIDFKAKDSLGREWQLATIQLDFNLPERFGLSFIDDKGEDSRVVMIHRAILGSVERFMAILIEHYAGVLPLWLSPTQVKVLPISDDQFEYADEITKELKQAGIRAEIDSRAESIGKKIRESEIMKVPVMLIIGEKEQTAKEVSIRKRGQEDAGTNRLPTLIEELVADINNRT
jgi:threonyl-tRNA synthetase